MCRATRLDHHAAQGRPRRPARPAAAAACCRCSGGTQRGGKTTYIIHSVRCASMTQRCLGRAWPWPEACGQRAHHNVNVLVALSPCHATWLSGGWHPPAASLVGIGGERQVVPQVSKIRCSTSRVCWSWHLFCFYLHYPSLIPPYVPPPGLLRLPSRWWQAAFTAASMPPLPRRHSRAWGGGRPHVPGRGSVESLAAWCLGGRGRRLLEAKWICISFISWCKDCCPRTAVWPVKDGAARPWVGGWADLLLSVCSCHRMGCPRRGSDSCVASPGGCFHFGVTW